MVTQSLSHDMSEPKSAEEAASSHTPAFPVLLLLRWVLIPVLGQDGHV